MVVRFGPAIRATRRHAPSTVGGMPTPTTRRRPPLVADERTQLVGWLDLQREIVRWKCDGLSDQDAHRLAPPELAADDRGRDRLAPALDREHWFRGAFLDGPGTGAAGRQPAGVEDDDFRVEGIPLAKLLRRVRGQCARLRRVVADHSLDDVGQHARWRSGRSACGWMLHHMLEETARHAGHLDLIRELLDGEKGYF